MKKILVISKKELKGFFLNPTFYIVCFLVALVFSWVYPISLNVFADQLKNYMFSQVGSGQQYNIHYGVFLRQLSYLNLMLIFIVPALTMRLLAEEKKMRTYDLLLTSPIESKDIIIGKYIGVLGAILFLVGIAFLYPLMTAFFVKVSWSTLIIAFFGIFLVGAVYAAMNLFCSSLTESAIVSYVMAVIFNIAIWFIGIGVEVVDSAWARQVFEHISINGHLSHLVEGTVRTSALVFIGSLITLFCFLAERVVEATRWR